MIGSEKTPIIATDVFKKFRPWSGTVPHVLTHKVKRALVGTHSEEIEHGLRRLFHRLGWRSQYDVPMNGQVWVDDTVVTFGDGVQVWINPDL